MQWLRQPTKDVTMSYLGTKDPDGDCFSKADIVSTQYLSRLMARLLLEFNETMNYDKANAATEDVKTTFL